MGCDLSIPILVRRDMRPMTFVPVVLLALAACSSGVAPEQAATTPASQTQTQTQAAAADTVSIRLGQTVQLDGGRLELTFDTRASDSRCPIDVVCVWQGDAVMQLSARIAGGERRAVELHSGREPTSATVERYTIAYVGLVPHPGSEARDATPVVTVQVRR